MKKYTITIISVLLCCTPVHAQVNRVEQSVCQGYPEEDCYTTTGCGFNIENNTCEQCPAGTYSNGSYFECKSCYKPDDAVFYTDTQYAGTTHPEDCPWYIICDENQHIDTTKWDDGKTAPSAITCVACPEGYYKYAQTRQSWNVNDNEKFITEKYNGVDIYTNTDRYIDITNEDGHKEGCSKKQFNIAVSVTYIKTCETGPEYIMYDEANIKYYTGTIAYDGYISLDEIEKQIEIEKQFPTGDYIYPSYGNFTLTPSDNCSSESGTSHPKMILENGAFTPTRDIAYWNHNCQFTMNIELVQGSVIDLYYCIQNPNTTLLTGEVCTKFIYDPCNPNAKNPSDIPMLGDYPFGSNNIKCEGSYYDGWNYHINSPSAGTAQKINFGGPMPTLQDDTKAIYMILNAGSCQPGTYYNDICTTKCNICPEGTSSDTGAIECTPCDAGTYNNTPGGTCTKCADGYFSGTGATECSQCPTGFTADTGATSWNDCYMNPTLDFIDIESSAKKLLLTAPNKVYYQGNL